MVRKKGLFYVEGEKIAEATSFIFESQVKDRCLLFS